MHNPFGFVLTFLLSLLFVNSRIIEDASKDGINSHEFKLINIPDDPLVQDLKKKMNSPISGPFGEQGFYDPINFEDDSDDENYDNEENERRIEKKRRMFEMAGARFSPNFEALLKLPSTTPNMTDL